MKIFTTDGIRRISERTIENDNLSSLDMMERAASAVTYEIMSRWRTTKRIVMFAGPGDNGGDTLAVARMLAEQGYHPAVSLFNIRSSHLSRNCSEQRNRLLEVPDVEFIEVTDTFNPPELTSSDVVIDGLFGSGLLSPLRGGYTALVQYINNSDAYVVSIDVPSGLFGEWNMGSDHRNIIRADLTLTYQFKRLSYFFAENAEFVGQCQVLDMEMNAESVAATGTDFYLIERDDVHAMLHERERDPFSNKYDVGAIMLVAGSYGMMGAAVLAARGAMRSGAGLVTIHAPRRGYEVLQTAIPEAIFQPDRNEVYTTEIALNHVYSVVALGPGMGTSDETLDAVDSFLKSYRIPCLLDADALNCIAKRPMLLRSIPRNSILTPHAIEFDRLFGSHTTDEERLKKAIDVARLHEITIVLKGHYTMTVMRDGKVYINSSGNSSMATAGSGDVLTGTIASLIGQGYPADYAAVMGVYIHGHAGDLAAQQHGYGVMASDIADNLGRAIRDLM
jgi:NAD(P)H-hydrate epimerase